LINKKFISENNNNLGTAGFLAESKFLLIYQS